MITGQDKRVAFRLFKHQGILTISQLFPPPFFPPPQDGTLDWNQLFPKIATVLANQQFSKKNVSLEKNLNKT